MKHHGNADNRTAGSERENSGNARGSDSERRPGAARVRDGRRSHQQQVDASHESDVRGEHRYDDSHQTQAEQANRQKRDDLKQRLAGARRLS
jgi:hypothetical protein